MHVSLRHATARPPSAPDPRTFQGRTHHWCILHVADRWSRITPINTPFHKYKSRDLASRAFRPSIHPSRPLQPLQSLQPLQPLQPLQLPQPRTPRIPPPLSLVTCHFPIKTSRPSLTTGLVCPSCIAWHMDDNNDETTNERK